MTAQERAALVAFCEATAAGCRTEALHLEVEAQTHRRDGSLTIESMYLRLAESARERAAKFDALAALAARDDDGAGLDDYGAGLAEERRQKKESV